MSKRKETMKERKHERVMRGIKRVKKETERLLRRKFRISYIRKKDGKIDFVRDKKRNIRHFTNAQHKEAEKIARGMFSKGNWSAEVVEVRRGKGIKKERPLNLFHEG